MAAHVQAVRQALDGLEGWDRRDSNALKPLLDFCHPFVEWDVSAVVVDGGVYAGRQGVADFFCHWLGHWSEWRFEIESVSPVEDGRVVTAMREWGVSRQGIPAVQRHAQVWTLYNGRLRRLKAYPTIQAATVSLDLSVIRV